MSRRVEDSQGLRPTALSLSDSARYSGFSKSYIRQQIRLGRLASVRLGPRAIRVMIADLDAFLGAHRSRSGEHGGL
jgi:excisionase family DNA binding protein